MKTQPIFELIAKGETCNGYSCAFHSKYMFKTEEEAKEEIETFKANCCDSTKFEYLDEKSMEIHIMSRELVLEK